MKTSLTLSQVENLLNKAKYSAVLQALRESRLSPMTVKGHPALRHLEAVVRRESHTVFAPDFQRVW